MSDKRLNFLAESIQSLSGFGEDRLGFIISQLSSSKDVSKFLDDPR
jgi:hypothetical protein